MRPSGLRVWRFFLCPRITRPPPRKISQVCSLCRACAVGVFYRGRGKSGKGKTPDITITNTHTPATIKLTVTKKWDDEENQDGLRPEEITVRLLANGQEEKEIQVTEEQGWSYTYEELPRYENGQEIEYSIEEDVPQGYEQTRNERVEYTQLSQKYELENRHVPSQIDIQVCKTWEDASDQDGLRPDEIVVHLLKNGEDTGKHLTLTEQDNWAAKTFEDLDEYANGVKIDYTVEEDAVVGYEANVEEEAENVFAITNTHVPGKISVSVSKIWEDDGDRDGLRPDKITVNLLADGKFLQSKEIPCPPACKKPRF